MSYVGLIPPCSYQGGKQRLASQIIDIILEEKSSDFVFYDLCCGSGAVSLELLNRYLNNIKVVMVDKGPFGAFWNIVGEGSFDIDILQREIDKLPEVKDIGTYLKEVSNRPVNPDLFIYHYLLLQAGAFGSKQIWVEKDKWCNNTFRNYWLPTETSNRKSPVNPMMPMPDTLLQRVQNILDYGKSHITGYNIDIQESIAIIKQDKREKIIYIDPPYKNTTGYLDTFDIYEIIKQLKGEKLFISEGIKLDGVSSSIILSEGRKKGNVSGTVKKNSVIETLNIF